MSRTKKREGRPQGYSVALQSPGHPYLQVYFAYSWFDKCHFQTGKHLCFLTYSFLCLSRVKFTLLLFFLYFLPKSTDLKPQRGSAQIAQKAEECWQTSTALSLSYYSYWFIRGERRAFCATHLPKKRKDKKKTLRHRVKVWSCPASKGFFHLMWKGGTFVKTEISPSSQWMSFPLPKGWNKASLDHWQHMEYGAAGCCLFPWLLWHMVLLLDRTSSCYCIYQKHLRETRSRPSGPADAMSSNPCRHFFPEFSPMVKLPPTSG